MLAYVDTRGQLLSSSHSSSSHWPLTTCCRFSQTWVVENIIFSPSFNLSPIFYVHHCSSFVWPPQFRTVTPDLLHLREELPKNGEYLGQHPCGFTGPDLEIQLGTWTCSSMSATIWRYFIGNRKPQETISECKCGRITKGNERQRRVGTKPPAVQCTACTACTACPVPGISEVGFAGFGQTLRVTSDEWRVTTSQTTLCTAQKYVEIQNSSAWMITVRNSMHDTTHSTEILKI